LIFAVLEWWLLQLRETDSSFVLYIIYGWPLTIGHIYICSTAMWPNNSSCW